ncbi:MAG: hypothetical protein AAF391_07580 [Bacteroidota bacterium]
MKNLIQKTIHVLNEIPNQTTSQGTSYELVSEISNYYKTIQEKFEELRGCLAGLYHMADDPDTNEDILHLEVHRTFPLYSELAKDLGEEINPQFQELYDESVLDLQQRLGLD